MTRTHIPLRYRRKTYRMTLMDLALWSIPVLAIVTTAAGKWLGWSP